jgi:hypothetical protein
MTKAGSPRRDPAFALGRRTLRSCGIITAMELTAAVQALAHPLSSDQERAEAAEVVIDAFKTLAHEMSSMKRENTALQRVTYLLVESHPDDELRDEMHSTYTKITSGTASPEE